MDQLIAKIVAQVGLDEATARRAVGIILSMFAKEGPADKVNELIASMPGAAELLADAPEPSSGSGGGLSGMLAGALGGAGPIMETLGNLQAQGLSVDQAKQVGQEVAGFAREKAGDDVVKEIAAAIPGLSNIM